MGNTISEISKIENQLIFIKLLDYISYSSSNSLTNPFVIYKYEISYQRYKWIIKKRFNEVYKLYSYMMLHYRSKLRHIPFPPRYFQLWRTLEDVTVKERGEKIAIYLETLASYQDCLNDPQFWEFFEVGKVYFLFLNFFFKKKSYLNLNLNINIQII